MTPTQLGNIVDYAPSTGKFVWRRRREESFSASVAQTAAHKCAAWNAKFAGREAFTSRSQDGYLFSVIGGAGVRAHRAAFALMTGSWPVDEVDHINGCKDDNRWVNLRAATKSQNMANTALRSDNTSGRKGVTRCARRGKWVARLKYQGTNLYLGAYDTADEAARAYNIKARELYGEFHRGTL